MTDCNTNPLTFSSLGRKKIQADFNGGCSSVKRISSDNLVGYKTRDEAINAGKRPCKLCKP